MVIPTVARSPTAATPTPYNPAMSVETQMIAQITRSGPTTDCMPTDKPVIMTVAGPVLPDSAMLTTGVDAV